jgi:hypothetical protein
MVIIRTLLRIAAAAVIAMPALGAFAQGSPDYNLDIVTPADEATVFDDNGDVMVHTTIVPDLANGDRVQLLVDGLPAAPPATSLEFPLAGITRGQHLLQARIIDSTGNVGPVSSSSTFYVWEASLLFPNRPGK